MRATGGSGMSVACPRPNVTSLEQQHRGQGSVAGVGGLAKGAEQALPRGRWFQRLAPQLLRWAGTGMVLLIALALRLFRLDYHPVWLDEAFSVQYARLPWDRLLAELQVHEAHPPFYYGLLHVWLSVQSTTDVWLRLPSAVFGVAIVAGVLTLGRELFGHRIALLGSTVAAIGAYAVWYSQEARMYAASGCFAVWSAWAIVRAIRAGGLWRWALFVAVSGFGLYTHYFFQFAVVGNLVAGAVLAGRTVVTRWRSLLIAHLALAAVWLPWLAAVLPLLIGQARWNEYRSLPEVFWETWRWQMFGPATAIEPGWWTTIAAALGAATAVLLAGQLVLARPERRLKLLALLTWLGVPLLLVWVSSMISRPIFDVRYLIVILPFLYLLSVTPLLDNHRWLRLSGAFVVVVLMASNLWSLGTYWFDPRYGKWDDFRSVAQFIEARAQPGDILIENDDDPSLRYYLYEVDRIPLPWVRLPSGGRSSPPSEADAQVMETINRYERIWLTIRSTRGYWDPQGLVEKALRGRCPVASHDRFGRVEVLVFLGGAACWRR